MNKCYTGGGLKQRRGDRVSYALQDDDLRGIGSEAYTSSYMR